MDLNPKADGPERRVFIEEAAGVLLDRGQQARNERRRIRNIERFRELQQLLAAEEGAILTRRFDQGVGVADAQIPYRQPHADLLIGA